jgi:lipopolysaccharide export system permease protein
MGIIKSLIIREWYKAFGGSAFVLFLILTVANLISGFLRMNVTPVEVLLNHLLELPANVKLIFPVSCLMASLFSINKLKNRNELTAIFASGYSRQRFLFDIIYAAATIALIQFFISSYLEPFAKSKRHLLIENSESKFRNLKSKGLRSSTIGSGTIWYKSNNYFFSFSAFDRKNNTLQNFHLFEFDENHHLKKQVFGPSAVFNGKSWYVKEANVHYNLNKNSFPKTQNIEEASLDIKETAIDFKQIEADITTLNTYKLFKYVYKLNQAGINVSEYLIVLLEKFSTAFICIVFSLVSSISIFNPNRRNSSFGKNLIFVFIFTLLYWLINSYFIELGKNGKIPGFWATFGVPLVFSFYLFFYYYRYRKLR